MLLRSSLIAMLCLTALTAQKYSGPRPPKHDVAYVVAGASSSARTPLAGPAFIFQSDKIPADKLQLYRFDVKNGQREVVTSHKGKAIAHPRRINVNPLGGGLFKIEVDEHLDNGEYGLTPEDSNQVFCFQVY